MRAFCNTHSDFQMQKTDLTNQIAAFLDMLCFKSDNEYKKHWCTHTNLDFSLFGKLV